MKFVISKPSRFVPKQPAGTLLLKQDNWNDYNFQTQYHLHFYRSAGSNAEYVGAVKILRRGQTSKDGLLIQKDFEVLPDEYVSVGESLDYYTRLSELLPDLKRGILDALRDVAMHPELESRFATDEGWGVSLFRGQKEGGRNTRLSASRPIPRHYRLHRASL